MKKTRVLLYKGWNIYFDAFGQCEYSIEVDGEDHIFSHLNDVKAYIDRKESNGRI